MHIFNYPFYKIDVDDKLIEGTYLYFNKIHVFIDYKFYRQYEELNIEKDHHIHIYVTSLYNLSDGFYKFIGKYCNMMNKKIFIHVSKRNKDMVKIVSKIIDTNSKLKLLLSTNDLFKFNNDDGTMLNLNFVDNNVKYGFVHKDNF